jgi:hypothetical protein
MVSRRLIFCNIKMLRKDYIMKMIEDFVKGMAKIIFNREMKNHAEAKDELDGLSKMVTGFEIEHLKSLGADGIVYVFGMNKETETEKIYCSARMLKEDGLISEGEGRIEESLKSFKIALELFELLSTREFDEKLDSLAEAELLKNKFI